MSRFEKITTGHKFEGTKLTYISESEFHYEPSGKRVRRVKCLCDCGEITIASLGQIKKKHTKSCSLSCGMKTHGATGSLLYERWQGMKNRVSNRKGYSHVDIYEPWLDFVIFQEWALANGFNEETKHTSLERRNSRGNYEPSNCHFDIFHIQGQNTSRCKWWFVDGVKYASSYEAAKDYNVTDAKIRTWCDGGVYIRKDGTKKPPKNNCWSELKYPN